MKRIKLPKDIIGLILVLALSAILNLSNLSIEGYSNEYYSAGVKSMLTSFKNFFFVSFDPTGFVSIDKPPLGFWIQVISAKIFGFNSWGLLLPQAMSGVISVFILYCLVKRYFGVKAGLISALCLSITPIFVAASRNNTIDNQLVMVVLIASYFLFRAIESGKLKHLILCLLFIAIGFNIKMLEAYLPIPAIYLTYFLASKIQLKKRIINLSICTVILLVVSLSWAIVVDLVPESNRPYVGSSSDNSEIQLIVGHNGLERFNRSREKSDIKNTYEHPEISSKNAEIPNIESGRIPGGTGASEAGITRLFSKGELSDQISWLLPFAIVGFLAAALKENLKRPFDNERKLSAIFWIVYLLPQFFYFSFTKGIFHSYYLTMLAPAIGALVGIGIKYLMEFYREETWKSYLLPCVFIIDGALELLILSYYFESYSITKVLMVIVLTLSFGGAIALITIKIKNKSEINAGNLPGLSKILVSIGLIGLLVAPAVWSGTTVFYKMSGSSPEAGLELTKSKGSSGSKRDELSVDSLKIINYLESNKSNEKYLLVTLRASGYASSIILETNESVMALGGFMGSDNIVTLEQFKAMVKKGDIRHIMVESMKNDIQDEIGMPQDSLGTETSENQEIMNWVKENGKLVDKSEWSNSSDNKIANIKPVFNGFNMAGQASELYDLKGCVN